MSDTHDRDEQGWQELEEMKEHINQITIPPDINERIRRGIQQARHRRKRKWLIQVTACTASLFIVASIASVRLSSTVAAYIGDIPGLRSIVQMINYDKGLQLAIQNEFMQPVGLSEEHDGIKMTIDGIMVDEARTILFYTLENVGDIKGHRDIRDVKLSNLTEYFVSYGSTDFNPEWKRKQGMIDFNLQKDSAIPEHLQLELKLTNYSNQTDSVGDRLWDFDIPVNKAKFEAQRKETYQLNQTVTVEGQNITFGKVTIYPTRIAVEVGYDPANTKKLFNFDDIRIEDENGEVFGTIMNGQSGSVIDENHQIIYFQSNYFLKPKRLFLRASSIRALDKDKLQVKIDVEHKELLVKPDDRISIKGVGTRQPDGRQTIDFMVAMDDDFDQGRVAYNVFDFTYTDAANKSFRTNKTGFSQEWLQYVLQDQKYKNPITLTIVDYPTRIYGDIDLRMK